MPLGSRVMPPQTDEYARGRLKFAKFGRKTRRQSPPLPYHGSVIGRRLLSLLAPFALCVGGLAQEPIRFLADKKLWVLDTGNSSYVFGVNERGQLQHAYWGGKLWRDADLAAVHSAAEWASFDGSASTTPGEYAGWGSIMYTEPCLKVTLDDGNRDLVLRYVSHEIHGDTL